MEKDKGKEKSEDPSLPNIWDSEYSKDDFRINSFKVVRCPRANYHDWTKCPFLHPEEHARRRDPRKHQYGHARCPYFMKGSCKKGNTCGHAHGWYEWGLHPNHYRTKICKDVPNCNRLVCFYAHKQEQLRSKKSQQVSSSLGLTDQAVAPGVSSPTHKSAVGDQLQQPQRLQSPTNANILSPSNGEHHSLQAPSGPKNDEEELDTPAASSSAAGDELQQPESLVLAIDAPRNVAFGPSEPKNDEQETHFMVASYFRLVLLWAGAVKS